MIELLIQLFPLVIIIFAAFLLLAITLWKRNSPAKLRDIPALSRLYRMLGLSVEDGTRLQHERRAQDGERRLGHEPSSSRR